MHSKKRQTLESSWFPKQVSMLTFLYSRYKQSILAWSWSSKCFLSSTISVCNNNETDSIQMIELSILSDKKILLLITEASKQTMLRKKKNHTVNIKSGDTSYSIRFLSFPRIIYNLSNKMHHQFPLHTPRPKFSTTSISYQSSKKKEHGCSDKQQVLTVQGFARQQYFWLYQLYHLPIQLGYPGFL